MADNQVLIAMIVVMYVCCATLIALYFGVKSSTWRIFSMGFIWTILLFLYNYMLFELWTDSTRSWIHWAAGCFISIASLLHIWISVGIGRKHSNLHRYSTVWSWIYTALALVAPLHVLYIARVDPQTVVKVVIGISSKNVDIIPAKKSLSDVIELIPKLSEKLENEDQFKLTCYKINEATEIPQDIEESVESLRYRPKGYEFQLTDQKEFIVYKEEPSDVTAEMIPITITIGELYKKYGKNHTYTDELWNTIPYLTFQIAPLSSIAI